MFQTQSPNLTNVVKVLVDGGYRGEKFANAVDSIIGVEVEVAKRNELHTFEFIRLLLNRY